MAPVRRALLAGVAVGPLFAWAAVRRSPFPEKSESRFATLEGTSGGRLGVAAFGAGNGRFIGYREHELFPMCSTFKMLLVALVLADANRELLSERLHFSEEGLVAHSPVTTDHVANGMTVAELCEATIRYSDNTAANLLLDRFGGPRAVTAFARTLGDTITRLDRNETELNTAIPGDERDTTTPAAMIANLRHLLLANAMSPSGRARLTAWLLGNTTGGRRIRAAVPAGWRVGDKTGSGDHGTANDIAIIFPPAGRPILLAIYTTGSTRTPADRDQVIADAAIIVLEQFGR